MVAAVVGGSGLDAGALIAEGAKVIKGGGGRGTEVAMAGGKDPGGIDEALALASAAAGVSD